MTAPGVVSLIAMKPGPPLRATSLIGVLAVLGVVLVFGVALVLAVRRVLCVLGPPVLRKMRPDGQPAPHAPRKDPSSDSPHPAGHELPAPRRLQHEAGTPGFEEGRRWRPPWRRPYRGHKTHTRSTRRSESHSCQRVRPGRGEPVRRSPSSCGHRADGRELRDGQGRLGRPRRDASQHEGSRQHDAHAPKDRDQGER